MKRLSALLLLLLLTTITAFAQVRGRERLSFNEGWRFQKGDPAGTDNRLSYEQIKNWLAAARMQIVDDVTDMPYGDWGYRHLLVQGP